MIDAMGCHRWGIDVREIEEEMRSRKKKGKSRKEENPRAEVRKPESRNRFKRGGSRKARRGAKKERILATDPAAAATMAELAEHRWTQRWTDVSEVH